MALRVAVRLKWAAICAALLVGLQVIDRAGAEAPEPMQRLIESANVTFTFYDPIREPKIHPGYTTFRFDVRHKSSYQYRWEDRPSGRWLTIQPKINRITYQLTNEVQLPEYLNTDRRWNHPTVRHEFDHVAMTVDPRIKLLIEHLCRKQPEIVRPLPVQSEVSEAMVEQLINQRVEPRYKAVVQLLIANQRDLDEASRHGNRKLPERKAYFRSLFTEPNLKKYAFPYLTEVSDLLELKTYREVTLPYANR